MGKRVLAVVLVLAVCATAPILASGQRNDPSRTNVEFWTFPDWGTGVAGDLFRTFVAEFEQANPDIRVSLVPKPELEQAIIAGAGAGVVPDAFTVAFNVGDTMLRTGIVQDVGPWFNAMPDSYRSQFAENWMAALSPDGKVYGLPFTAYAQLLYRNTTVLEQAGVDTTRPIRDWADWLEQMVQVHQAGFYALPNLTQDGWFVMGFVGAAGGRNGVSAGRTTVDEAALREALVFYQLLQRYSTEIPAGDQAAVDMFTTNQLAFYIMGPWQNPAFQDARVANPAFDYDYTLVPGASSDLFGGTNGGEWIGVTSGPRAEAAWKWAAYLADAPQTTRFAADLGRTVLNDVAMADPRVQENTLNVLTAQATKYGFADAAYFTFWPLDARVPFRDAAQAVYAGRSDASAAARQALSELNAVLARGR